MKVNRKLLALFLLVFGAGLGYLVYISETPDQPWSRPFLLGLDLRGGSHLVYEADTATLASTDVAEAMSALREVIERRINAFGITEPVIQAEEVGLGADAKHRLIIELPGVTDLDQALALIKETPLLEFAIETSEDSLTGFAPSGLTGRFLRQAEVRFSGNTLGPTIALQFNDEGAKILADLTKNNINKALAIVLDGQLLSAPIIRDPIANGQAEITGQFSIEEAQALTRNLNLGALPVPIQLLSTQTVGATLGDEALRRGLGAGWLAFVVIALFMLIWYRLPGLVAVVSLGIYITLMLSLFKLLPVTLTSAGIAGFILSVGMAVDANILIFERTKEEIKKGSTVHEAIMHGFSRAWSSIRDSNLSTIISAIILFWFGSSLIKGFALVLGLGVLVSMFTAITVTRTFLLALGVTHSNRFTRFLFGSGLPIGSHNFH